MNTKYLQPTAYFRKAKYTFAKLLFVLGVPLRVTTSVDSLRIAFIASSYTEYVLRARESYRREQVTMYWLREIVMAGDVLYDIGANVGAYSLYAGKKMKGSQNNVLGLVYAFEPAFSNFFPLCRNIELNGLNDVVVPFPIGFGEKRYEADFFLRTTSTGSALHGLDEPNSEGKTFDPAFKQGISVVSIDEFVRNDNVRFPNHIKIDVDGSEQRIINGAKHIFSDQRLKSIMIEINEDIYGDEIDQFITAQGFELTKMEKWGERNTYNKLFCRKESALGS